MTPEQTTQIVEAIDRLTGAIVWSALCLGLGLLAITLALSFRGPR